MSEKPNIIFLVLDTARARSFSPYNNGESNPPFTTQLAEDNILFEEAITPAPWTLPAHVSMFTGLTPSEHQVNSWEDRLSEESDTLASLVSENGYQSIGFSHNMWLSNTFGLTTGFDDFNEQWQLFQSDTNLFQTAHHLQGLSSYEKVQRIAKDILSNNPATNIANAFYAKFIHNRHDHGAQQTNRNIKKWINSEWDQSSPFFLFANYLEPHIEYNPPTEFAQKYCQDFTVEEAKNVPQEPVRHMLGNLDLDDDQFKKLKSLYKGEIDYLDSKIEELFEILSDSGVLDNSLVILVGDHGENLGEDSMMSHMYSLKENLIHVPCIVKTPDNMCEDISKPIQTQDLFSLCLHYSDSNPPENVDAQLPPPWGSSRNYTVSELLAENPPETAVQRETKGEYDSQKFSYLRKKRRVIRRDGYKYEDVINGPSRIYNIKRNTEVIVDDNEKEQDLHKELQEYISNKHKKSTTEESSLDGNIENQLKDLGYL